MTPPLKKFILRVGIYSVIILVLLGIGEVVVEHIPNSYRAKANAVKEYGADIETLFLGHSHFYYGVIADSIPSSLNLALPGQDLDYQGRILEQLKSEMPNLKRVVWSLAWFSLYDRPSYMAKPSVDAFYKIYMGVEGERTARIPVCLELIEFTPSYCNKIKNLFLHREEPDSVSPYGFGLDYVETASESELRQMAHEAASRHNTIGLGYEDANRKYFERFAEECRKEGLNMIVVITPLSQPYREMINPEEVRRTRAIMKGYQNRYGFEILDFSADARFGEGDFYDSDHLNRDGAEKFTRILRDTLGKY